MPAGGGPAPVEGGMGKFKLLAQTQAEEDAFDFVGQRTLAKPVGNIGSVAHIVKGALGAGILGGHVGWMKAGVGTGMVCTFIFGSYIAYCLYILVAAAHVLYKRCRVTTMSYSDLGEAAFATFPNPSVARWAIPFRIFIDVIICIDLFGSCICYQLIISHSVKQLTEGNQITSVHPTIEGYPSLRVYLAAFILPVILICLITELKYLAPFSIVANLTVLLCIMLTVYYSLENNPTMSHMQITTSLGPTLEYLGMAVFSMSCAGVILPITNNMYNPEKYGGVLCVGMSLIVCCVFVISLFGYSGYLQLCESPITLNFPVTSIWPKILKGFIAFMIYVTHALNFWVPFNLCFYYVKMRIDPNKKMRWELCLRALFVLIIGVLAIVFPNINSLMGFLGAFCLSNMAFIWPNMIELLVVWHRPGLGPMKWRLWKSLFLIAVGIFLCIVGSYVNFVQLVKTAMSD